MACIPLFCYFIISRLCLYNDPAGIFITNIKNFLLMNEFQFNTKLDQTILLGLKAKNLSELAAGIKKVPESSIYYHTHRFLRQHHFLSPEPPNDFAYWTTEVLNEQVLGERIRSVDIIQFHNLNELRKVFLDILMSHLQKADRQPTAPQGQEFHFMASRTFVLKTPYAAGSLKEFKEMLKLVSINSLYYHIFESKLRLEKQENDFSRWFSDLGKTELADQVERLDPYTYTLEGLRSKLIQLVEKYDTH
jgi:hypothetical protein